MTWVVDELDRLCRLRGKPRSICVDNRPEFAGRHLDQRTDLKTVELDFSRPGKPGDNDAARPPLRDDIEAFNSRLRQECRNASWVLSMGEARIRIEAWRIDHTQNRPHSALGLRPAVPETI